MSIDARAYEPPTLSVWGVGGYPCRRARAGSQRGTSGSPRIQVMPPARPRRGTNSRNRELAEAGRSVVVPFNRQYEAAGRAPTPPHGRASFSVGRPSALGSFSRLPQPPASSGAQARAARIGSHGSGAHLLLRRGSRDDASRTKPPPTSGWILLTRVSRSDRASFTEPSKIGQAGEVDVLHVFGSVVNVEPGAARAGG